MTSATPRSISVSSGRYHIMSNASIVNNCILLAGVDEGCGLDHMTGKYEELSSKANAMKMMHGAANICTSMRQYKHDTSVLYRMVFDHICVTFGYP